MSWADHFSSTASEYARYRPTYPEALFDYLAAQCPRRGVAWDCGTGNGQAASALSERFQLTVASEPSPQQLAGFQGGRARPVLFPAYPAALADHTVDLIAVAQALHWFAGPDFYAEVRRVARAGALFAAWSYDMFRIDARIDQLVREFAYETVGAYWPPERAIVERHYVDLQLPIQRESDLPDLHMRADWSLQHVLAYIGTWSAVNRCREATGTNPVEPLADALRRAWGEDAVRPVVWPLFARIGRVA